MPDAASLLYFAYGSNMLTRRLQARTPSARRVAVGWLPRHELRWHKAGADGSGKCDVVAVEHDGAQVQGVVYRLATADKPFLDTAEGLGVGYAEQRVTVHTADGPVAAWTYMALRTDPTAVPYAWYKALVLGGALEHGLDEDYLRRLQSVGSKDDADAARAALHFALMANMNTA